MSRKLQFIGIFGILAVCIIYWSAPHAMRAHAQPSQAMDSLSFNMKKEVSPPTAFPASSGIARISESSLRSLTAQSQDRDRKDGARIPQTGVAYPPKTEVLREEVKSNPHTTPLALLRFGAEMGERMSQARKSESAARRLLNDLRKCSQPVRLEDSPAQARALCLITAKELGEIWPDLTDDADSILDNADLSAVRLASRLERFQN